MIKVLKWPSQEVGVLSQRRVGEYVQVKISYDKRLPPQRVNAVIKSKGASTKS